MRTSTEHHPFIWSDAWLLTAVLYTAQPDSSAKLSDIIACGDGLNHAIFTRGELETGFSRLIDAGYVVRDASGFSPTPAVRSFWISSRPESGNARDAWLAVRTFIRAPAYKPDPLPETDEQRYVTELAYAEACETYQRQMAPLIKKYAKHDASYEGSSVKH
jgi:hypothetical protein